VSLARATRSSRGSRFVSHLGVAVVVGLVVGACASDPSVVDRGCSAVGKARADLDGDAVLDSVSLAWNEERGAAVLSVCTARGVGAELEVAGQAEYLETVDIQSDGHAEILAGGTTAGAALATMYVLAGDRLVPVRFADGTELGVAEGFDAQGPKYEWTCASGPAGGPPRTLVLRERSSATAWHVRTVAVDGASARVIEERDVARSTSPEDGDIALHAC